MFRITAIAMALALTGAAQAQNVSTRPVAFSPERPETALNGQVSGRESVQYTFRANAGQSLDLQISPANPGLSWALYAPGALPGSGVPIRSGAADDRAQSVALSGTGLYILHIFTADGASPTDYRLTMRIGEGGGDTAAQPASSGPAEGWLQVTGVSDMLNMRAQPSTSAGVVMRLRPGAVARDLGCKQAEGREWCQLQYADGTKGWAAASYLSRASGQGASAQPAPAATTPPAPAASPADNGQPAPRPARTATPAAGSPDGWFTVTGVSTSLNLRTAPSTSAQVAARVPAGAQLRDLGCEQHDRRWCRVEAQNGVTGWAAGDFLTPGKGGQPSASQGAQVVVGGLVGQFDSAGKIPCSPGYGVPTASCDYGLRRSGDSAQLVVAWPGGGSRVLDFSNGEPAARAIPPCPNVRTGPMRSCGWSSSIPN